MKRLLSTIIISILFVTPSFAESTQEMLSACKSLTTNIKMSGDKATISNTFDGGKCWGAFMAIQNMLYFYEGDGTTPTLGVCVPKEVTRTQLISMFVKHVYAIVRDDSEYSVNFESMKRQVIKKAAYGIIT